MSSASPGQRGSVSRHSIVDELRRRIVEEVYAPGAQLPIRTELEREFEASSVTVQRAMDHLRREGFIEVEGRQATRVAAHPPHVAHYAMVFGSSPANDFTAWSRFFQSLSNEATRLSKLGPIRIDLHYGVEDHADNQAHRQLVAAMRAHRYAGLIFASHPQAGLAQSPLVIEPGIPRVAIMAKALENIPAVTMEGATFIRKALGALKERGRTRVAVLANFGQQPVIEDLVREMAGYGMTTRPYWLQRVHLMDPSCARECVHLLFHEGQTERPDALVVTDDNLWPHAQAGLVDASVRVTRDLDVVAHHNFPWPSTNVLPAIRLGYDSRRILQACVASIDAQRQGKPWPAVSTVEAVFEHELTATNDEWGTKRLAVEAMAAT